MSSRHYRKTLLARMPSLNYLDDSPVFPKDRRLAMAFVDGGGIEAERAMRETIRYEGGVGEPEVGSRSTCAARAQVRLLTSLLPVPSVESCDAR